MSTRLCNLVKSLVVLLSLVVSCSSQLLVLDSNWTLTNQPRGIQIENVINLPASVHTILHGHGLIPDPLYQYNDEELRWVALDDHWTLTTEFQLPSDYHASDRAVLEFKSVDTVSDVYLNDQLVGHTDSQFVKYEWDVASRLRASNLLEVRFRSAIEYAKQLSSKYSYPILPECPPQVQKGECHVNLLRKEQCSFSWDWGPAFAPIGIYSAVKLRLVRHVDFHLHVSVYPADQNVLTEWLIDAELRFVKPFNLTPQLSTVANFRIDAINYEHKNVKIDLNQDVARVRLSLKSTEYPIELWWPAGYGPQHLYNLTVSLIADDLPIVEKSKSIAFRQVKLIQRVVVAGRDKKKGGDDGGLTFSFRINNVDIFLKGSNWIPADVFQDRVTYDYIRWLLESARDANMNVLRVWGGGVYEQDAFYDLADRLGIMIWQDFMFACSTYPTDEAFLSNVRKEIKYQVNRLRNHPSIIIWAGNNENEAAIATNWWNTDANKTLYENDYRKLYIQVIMSELSQLDSIPASRPFLASSPTNGLESESERWIAVNPYDLHYGDLHFYDYKMNGWSPDSFPVPRFMSEYGVQSLPSLSSLEQGYNMPMDANIYSRMNEYRQHHEDGNKQILAEIENNLRLPAISDRVAQFAAIIYLSQINQAMHYKTGTEVFRRARNQLDKSTGRGLCMGTMYWQFNDLWSAPTWSTIEYVANNTTRGGKWKMAHYYIKKAYSQFILSPYLNQSSLDIYSVSDLMSQFNTTYTISVYSYSSLTPVFEQSNQVLVEPLMSRPVLSLLVSDLESKSGCRFNANESCLLQIEWVSPDGSTDQNFLFFNNKLADVNNLNQANVRIARVDKIEPSIFSIQLTTDQVALFTWLDVNTSQLIGTFSQNGFHMTTRSKMINYRVQSGHDLTSDEFKQLLDVQTLSNIYNYYN